MEYWVEQQYSITTVRAQTKLRNFQRMAKKK
jgi:hypothetical protein